MGEPRIDQKWESRSQARARSPRAWEGQAGEETPWAVDCFLSAGLLLVSDAVIRAQSERETLGYTAGREGPLEQPELLVIWHLQYCLRDIFGIMAPCNLSLQCLPQCECQVELVL